MALRKLFISKPTEMWVFFRLIVNVGRTLGAHFFILEFIVCKTYSQSTNLKDDFDLQYYYG